MNADGKCKKCCRPVFLSIAGAIVGLLIGWAVPYVIDWLPVSSPIRSWIDLCFVGVEKKALSAVRLLNSTAPIEYSIVYTRVCFALLGAFLAVASYFVARKLRKNNRRPV